MEDSVVPSQQLHIAKKKRANWLENRFAFLLGALTLMLATSPLLSTFESGKYPRLGGILFTIAFAIAVLSAVFAVSRNRKTEIFALLLALPTITLQIFDAVMKSESVSIISPILGIAFLSFTTYVVLRSLFSSTRVSFDMICASLCVYLLLGVTWSMVYSLLQHLDSEAFIFAYATGADHESLQFGRERTVTALYYSFVTMSTLGYGDIVPRSSTARMAATIQAITGQLYLAVLVARLVGVHISQSLLASKD